MLAAPALGRPRFELRPTFVARWLDLFFALFLGGGAVTFLAGLHAPPWQPARDVAIGWAAGGLALVSPFFLWRSWRKRGLGAALHDGGFAYRDRRGVRSFTWNEIDAVWQRITRRYYNGVYAGTQHVYTVQPASGPRVVLDSALLGGVDKLGDVLVRESTARILARRAAAFDRGERLAFGRLALDQQGLHVGRRSLPWAAFRSVSVHRGFVRIDAAGRRLAFCRFRVAELPNFVVLMAFLEQPSLRAARRR